MRRLSAWVTLLLLPFIPVAALAQNDRPNMSGAGGAAGIGQYPPSSWGVVAATINNPTDREQQLLVTFNFAETATLQFATDIWIPPGTRRTVWLPMRTNQFEISETRPVTLPLRQQLIDNRGPQPVVLGEADGMLIASRDRWITGMLADGDDSDDEAISVALAIRRSVEYSRRMAYLNERNLPSMVAGWQGLNGLVISKNSLALDSAQTEAMRQWLLSGGKLWVMLDHVEPEVMPALLGDAWTLREVDRVRLSTVMVEPPATAKHKLAIDDDLNVSFQGKRIATLPADARARQQALETVKNVLRKTLDSDEGPGDTRFHIRITGGVSGEVATLVADAVREAGGQDSLVERDHERPVDLVRVLAPDMEVTHTVGGWPAAMRKPVGKGWLMVTTLGARGWMEPVLVPQTTVDGTEAKDDKGRTVMMWAHSPNRPLRDIADWFHSDRRADVLPPEAFDAYVSEQIGYQIVGRGTVFFVLTFFCAALLGAGLWLVRGGRLEHLGWVGASIAVVIALVLVVIGKANQSSVPMTVAQGQFIQVAPDQQQAIATGLICIYSPGGTIKRGDSPATGAPMDDSEATLEATAGGLILPADLSKLQSRQVRMVWTDVDRWHWRNVTMPSGANRRATFERVTPLNKPVNASITFDANGVVGYYVPGEIGPLSSMVIATPSGALATRPAPKSGEHQGYGAGGFLAGPGDALSAGQYISDNVLDDAQRRKQDVYRTLLGAPDEGNEDPLTAAIEQTKAPVADKGKFGAATRGGTLSRGRTIQFPDAPTLLGWADALPLGFRFPDAQQKLGASLVSIPLSIQRPAPGTLVTLPSAFLPYKVTRGRYGPTPSVFVQERHFWNASSVPGTLPLAFQLPAALLPMSVEKAKFTLDFTGPGATVEVLIERGGNLQSLLKVSNPSAALVVDLPADGIQSNAQGEIMVLFRVSYINPAERTLWRVKEAKLEVRGVVK
jgi:hypothetical protein